MNRKSTLFNSYNKNHTLKKKRNCFIFTGASISFDSILLWVDISSTFMGLTVFFAILQVMELLGLNQHVAILSSTLKVKAIRNFD